MGSPNERIVCVGGGHGPTRVARALKHIRRVTLIQTVFDRGGNTGSLRDDFGRPAMGDLRRGIEALAEPRTSGEHFILWALGFRFDKPKSALDNVSLGNLLTIGYLLRHGDDLGEDLAGTIAHFAELAGVREGKEILPVSSQTADLRVTLSDGTEWKHEGEIGKIPLKGNRIQNVQLVPSPHLHIRAYDTLMNADKIVIGPSSFYSSIAANIKVRGFPEALMNTKAKIIFPCNLITDPFETEGFTTLDFAREFRMLAGRKIDWMIVNTGEMPHLSINEARGGAGGPVKIVTKGMQDFVAHPLIKDDFAEEVTDGKYYHSIELARVIADL